MARMVIHLRQEWAIARRRGETNAPFDEWRKGIPEIPDTTVTPPRGNLKAGRPSFQVGARSDRSRSDWTRGAADGILTPPRWRKDAIESALDDLAAYNPDVSLAEWNLKQLAIGEFELEALSMETQEVDETGTAYLKELNRRVFTAYEVGGVRALLTVGLVMLIRRGGIAAELDVADSLDDVRDIDLIMPNLVDFKAFDDGKHEVIIPVFLRGGQASGATPFNLNQFSFVGINTMLGSPHGQPVFLSALETAYPQMTQRDSLELAAKNQGIARTEVSYDYERVVAGMPQGMTEDERNDYLDGVLQDGAREFEKMRPDDTWHHYDVAKAGTVGIDQSEGFRPGEIAQIFDQDLILSTKSQPAMHGRSWGAAFSSHGQVQWQVYATGIETLRTMVAACIEDILTKALRVRGIPAAARIRFTAEIRKVDRLQEAQAEAAERAADKVSFDLGLEDADTIALKRFGHPAKGMVKAPSTDARTPVPVFDRSADMNEDRAAPRFIPRPGTPMGVIELAPMTSYNPAFMRAAVRDFNIDMATSSPWAYGMLGADITERASGPRWSWNHATQRYTSPLGREIPPDRILGLLADMEQRALERARAVGQRLISGGSVVTWQRQVMQIFRTHAAQSAMLGAGGIKAMTTSYEMILSSATQTTATRVATFGAQIAAGELSEGNVDTASRRPMGATVRTIFEDIRLRGHSDNGFSMYRRVTTTNKPCTTCDDESRLGFVPIGSLRAIGDTLCGDFDACYFEYKPKEDSFFAVDLAQPGSHNVPQR